MTGGKGRVGEQRGGSGRSGSLWLISAPGIGRYATTTLPTIALEGDGVNDRRGEGCAERRDGMR